MINIEHLLPLVEKPSRYIDHEINACRKDFSSATVKMLLAFPDLYELGVSHLGLKILYSIVNRLDYAMADRMYLPWPDLLDYMKQENLPLFGVESRRAAVDFDLIGITLQSELTFTNVLQMIHSSHLEVLSKNRAESDPIIMAGGPCASNPLPLAPFIDVFFIGEAEVAIVEIAEILRDNPDKISRLKQLASLESCYVPALHTPGSIIKSRKYAAFHTMEDLHSPQILSWQLATHNRYVSEIMRGCSRGCRFCHAGYFYRPVRERNSDQILQELLSEIKQSGWDEAGLVSLSSSDYTCIRDLLFSLLNTVNTSKTHISLPSLRVDSLDTSLVNLMQHLGREGLTIAPEAGSQRLRNIINKNLSEEEILRGVEIALSLGWQKIKLYFMIGLPQESEEDIDGIIQLIEKINFMGKKRLSISVTISPFTPKPFTPFQWAAMLDAESLLARARRVKNSFLKAKNIRIKYHTIENSLLEACITRGDIGMANVIHQAWLNGACFDAWNENWDYSRWETAFDQCGIDPNTYLRERELSESLPWDFIDIGVCNSFLVSEYQKALAEEVTDDCRELCSNCGACDEEVGTVNADPVVHKNHTIAPKTSLADYNPQIQFRYRVYYTKTGLLRFISHLDWMRMLFRRISVLELPTVFTMGFSPHPKVGLSPALPVGVESTCEYFDISFFEKLETTQIVKELQRSAIPDFAITSCEFISGKASIPTGEKLLVQMPDSTLIAAKIADFSQRTTFEYTKTTEKRSKTYDLKSIIKHLELEQNTLVMDKLLESPSLYDVLEAITDIPKTELYRCKVMRSTLY